MSIHRTEPATPPAGEHLPALAQWVEKAKALIRDLSVSRYALGNLMALRQPYDDRDSEEDALSRKCFAASDAIRAHLSALPPVAAPRLSDEQIEQWAERHDIAGDEVTLRAIFEDARSLFDLSAPLAERPQGAASEPSPQAMPGSANMGLETQGEAAPSFTRGNRR